MRSPQSTLLTSFTELPIFIDVPTGPGAAGCRIAVADDLDRLSAPSLERAVIQVLREHRPDQLEFDLTGVAFVDAGGIRALLQCRLDAQQLGCRLTVTHVQPWVYRLLEIAGLPNLFEVRTL
jgi:anti-anti-sigma factor